VIQVKHGDIIVVWLLDPQGRNPKWRRLVVVSSDEDIAIEPGPVSQVPTMRGSDRIIT
jgi:hypothetical protein